MEKEKLPNSTASLVLGIISIVFACCCSIVGSVIGVIGLVLANKAIALHNVDPSVYKGFDNAKAGKILNIIGIVLGAIMLVVGIMQIINVGGIDAYMESIREQMQMMQGLE